MLRRNGNIGVVSGPRYKPAAPFTFEQLTFITLVFTKLTEHLPIDGCCEIVTLATPKLDKLNPEESVI